MCFVRLFIPWEDDQLSLLTDQQKIPVIAFIYECEVMGEGHMGFMEMYREHILIDDIINAFKILSVPKKYIDNLINFAEIYISQDQVVKQCSSEKEFEKKMEEIDCIYEPFDATFYEDDNVEIEDRIIAYVRKNWKEFFVIKE